MYQIYTPLTYNSFLSTLLLLYAAAQNSTRTLYDLGEYFFQGSNFLKPDLKYI